MISKLKKKIASLWGIPLLRFFVIGGVNTIFGYSVYAILLIVNIHYSLSLFIALVLGIFFNFFTTGRFVFNNTNKRLIVKFFTVYGVTYLINLGFLRIFEYFNFNMLIAQMILTLPTAFLSYYLNKRFVFKEQNNHDCTLL